jgi:hypothetical protein
VADNEYNVSIKVEPGECFPGIIHCRISHVAYSINQSPTESRSGLEEVCCVTLKMDGRYRTERTSSVHLRWGGGGGEARTRGTCVNYKSHIGTVMHDTASS